MDLHSSGKAPTTIKAYLLSVKNFLKFLEREDFSHVRLSKKRLRSIKMAVDNELRNLTKDITTHRQEVRSVKTREYIIISM